MKYLLWILQILFVFTGVVKLILPVEEMTSQMPVPLPGFLLRFVVVAPLPGRRG
jgi:hypothetical protein